MALARLPPELASLLEPAAYPHPVTAVDLVETHVSWVFLTGEFAYKVKRPVCYPFVDLRSAERRAFFCAEELRLNRRFAPMLYLEVCPVTRMAEGMTRIGGAGELIDHAVKMRQFRADDELDRLLECGTLAPSALAEFGRSLAAQHARCPVVSEEAEWGHPEKVRAVLLRNLEECLQEAAGFDTAETLRALQRPYTALIDAAVPCMAQRRAAGRVRECHGDLHARNVTRYLGSLIAFDCMEFEPAFRWIDVAEEIAFLCMDLLVRAYPRHAQAFLDGYLFESGDYEACRTLRPYSIHRALVRAKVAAIESRAPTPARRAVVEHHRYVHWAHGALTPPRPRLILISGLSGSGKTWLAQRLAAALGAIHVRSDVERKRLAGLREHDRSQAPLAEGLYSAGMSEQTYARLRECAAHVLAGRYAVIVDATFHRCHDRASFRTLAAELASELVLIACEAPPRVIEERVRRREQESHDASEANLEVLAWQRERFEAVSADEGFRVIEADTSAEDVVERVLARLAA